MTRSDRASALALVSLLGLFGAACGDDGPDPKAFREELLDPENCATCHPRHYEQWLGSMHAYAADDPVFRAFNARGQRDTDGQLGSFCVQCHAPMAVELGLTEDGLNLDEVPQHLRGVTCYYCHNVDAVEGTHNNPLRLAMDGVMRGGVDDPVRSDFHAAEHNRLQDGRDRASSDMCGSCHDIVSPAGAHMERTYVEWLDSFFADVDPATGLPPVTANQCGGCHMGPGEVGAIADVEGVPGDRTFHSHLMAGVDVAITDFPDAEQGPALREAQLAAMERVRKNVLCSSMCVRPTTEGAEVLVWLHNEAAGHSWPSGANADRRAWVELVAWGDDPAAPIYSSGLVDEGTAILDLDDPDLWIFRDRLFDADGMETHLFWEAASFEANGLAIPPELSVVADAATWVVHRYPLPEMPERLTLDVKLRPFGLDIADDLIGSGDLDPAFRSAFPTFTIEPAALEWPYVENPEDPSPPWTADHPELGSCIAPATSCRAPELRD